MSAIYITAMGSQFTGSGININAVSTGDDGWIYLAGTDSSTNDSSLYDQALTVLGYKDGQLQWKQDFNNASPRGTFEALVFKNGSVYAAGAISIDFKGEDLAETGGAKVTAPMKAATDEDMLAFYSVNPSLAQDPTFQVYVKLDGKTGEVQLANVLASPNVQGDDRLRSIDVDSLGNVYVAGGGWNHGENLESSVDNEYYWFTRKFLASGEQDWSIDGETVVLDQNTNTPYLTKWGNTIVSLHTNDGTELNSFSTGFQSNQFTGEGHWIRSWVFDSAENIYVLAGRTVWNQNKADLDQQGVLVKINKDGTIDWETPIGTDADFCLPNSVTFSPSGSLLISGQVLGMLEGKTGFGGKDGFILEVDPDTGSISSTQIIGTLKNESISEIIFQPVFNEDADQIIDYNMVIGGSFEVYRYSLEGGNNNEIYLISDKGFELIGNANGNIIQGGSGDDSISSGGGDDTIVGGEGSDSLNGGDGRDTASYEHSKSSVKVDLTEGQANGVAIGIDALISIENVIGSTKNDTIIGSSTYNEITAGSGDDYVDAGDGDDLIVGGDGAGNDIYIGGEGTDTVKYTSAKAGISINLSARTNQAKSTLTGDSAGIGIDQLSGIENIIAGSFDDLLTGNSAANLLIAGSGKDTIDGGSGVAIDTIDGGTSIDTVSFASLTASMATAIGVTLNLASTKDTNGYVTASGLGGADKIKNIENIVGSSYADTLTGDSIANTLNGGAGNDTLNGGEGDDQLDGGAGSDALNGGNGNDRYLITALTGGDDTVTDTGGTNDALVWNSGTSPNTYIDVSRGGSSTTNANLVVKVYQDGVLKQTNTVVGQFSNTVSTATTISGTAPTSAIERLYISDDDQYLKIVDGFLKIVDGLTGTASDELIVGTAGANTLTGNAGIDFMYGGAGNDTLNGGEGDDQLDGGAGSDALNGGNGNDRYQITALTGGDDTVTDTGGTADVLVWNGGTSPNTYIDVSRGGSSTTNANLVVKVYQDGVLKQTNTVVGQFSNTVSTATTISGTAPTSAIEGVYIADDDQYLKIVDGLTGTASDELIVGTAGANTLTGNAGIDFMYGGAGNDTLNGGEGDDQLDGGAGSDALNGGNGNDRYQITALTGGDDTVTDTGGTADVLVWNGGTSPNTYIDVSRGGSSTTNANLVVKVYQDGVLKQTNTVVGQFSNTVSTATTISGTAPTSAIEGVYIADDDQYLKIVDGLTGTASDELIVGTAGANTLTGNAGIDFMYGGAGNDTLNGGEGDDQLDGGAGSDALNGGNGNDRYQITALTGGDDTVTDTGGTADVLVWNGGTSPNTYIDVSRGGSSTTNANLVVKVYQDGVLKQTNTVVGQFSNTVSTATTISGTAPTSAIEGVYIADDDQYLKIVDGLTGTASDELIVGTAGANTLTGNAGIDFMYGGAGNDTLNGGEGDDQLDGGAGSDALNGGNGNDRYQITALTGGDDTVTDTGGTADVLVWNGGTSPNTYIDVSRGGSSTTNANLVVKVYQDGVLKQTNTVVGQFSNTVSTATTISGTAPTSAIEGVYIADDDQYLKIVDGLTGTASDELIVGTAGANTLTGNAGIDFMYGGAGNDTLNGGEGDDQLDGGAGSDALNGGNGNDRYQITALTGGDDTVTDTGGTADVLVWNGGTSPNTYIDVSRGGSSTTNANLVVKVYQDGVLKQTNTVVGQFSNTVSTATTISGTAPTSAIEGVYIADDDQYLKIVDGLTGTASDELIVGTAGANTLTGNAGIDFMYGGAGNDTLNGGEGDDQLDGGGGQDVMWGGVGNDIYFVDNSSDQVKEAISASNSADSGGSDFVHSFVTYSLGNYLEFLKLEGLAAINGTGNSLANNIFGNAAANTLNGAAGNDTLEGGAGNDTLIGGLGNDILTGGIGNDVFVFNSATANNLDTILDFTTGTDKIQLSKSIFANLGATGNLTENAFWAAAGAVKGNDANDRVVYNTTTGALYYDADGSGSGAAVQIALLGTSSHPTTAFTDFAVIA